MSQQGSPLVYPRDAITHEQYTLSRIIGGIIIVFFLFVLFLFMFHMYVRCFLRRSSFTSFFFGRRPAVTVPTTQHDATCIGLDKATISQLPTFIYRAPSITQASEARGIKATEEKRLESPQTGKENHASRLECAVCLSEFQDTAKGRLLPSCKHAFHIECIDMWLESHSTCPVCRAVVVPVHGDAQIPQTVMEDTRASHQNNGHMFTQANHGHIIVEGHQIRLVSSARSAKEASCSHSTPISCMRPLTQISISVPVSQANIVIRPPAASSSHPTRSLGLRLSFKRVLSRELSSRQSSSNQEGPEESQEALRLHV